MRKISSFIAACALLASTASFAGPTEDFEELREEMWEWTLDNSPQLATNLGDRRGEGKLSDLSLASFDQRTAQRRAFLERLRGIDRSALPQNLQLDYALLEQNLTDRIEEAQHDHARYRIFTNRAGWFISIASLPNRSPFFTVSDYRSYIERLEAFTAQNLDGIARSRIAVERQLTQPCEPMEGLEKRIASQFANDIEASPFWAPFAEQPAGILDEEWDDLKERGRAALTDHIYPAFRELHQFYVGEYAPNCRKGLPGVSQSPGGAAYYAQRVRSFTTRDMTPEEIHALGMSEVARIRAEMKAVAAKAGFDSREAYIEHLRTDPRYYPSDPDSYLEATAALTKQIDGWMPRLFATLPRLPYTVLPIPDEQAPGNTTAYYERGSLATGQAGIYRLNLTELNQRPLWELPALSVHEAVPGHHHQIALQQELNIHPIRRHGPGFTVFMEGWGLYSERLGIEMGLYDTSDKEMGRLSYEMWRAARLVVDIGIHALGWSKQEAVDFMFDNTALSAANIDAEVNRYITWPGQALAYKIGELKIRELRARATEALGSDFDLRLFHDAVLENGPMPLDVLEMHMDSWIAAQLAEK